MSRRILALPAVLSVLALPACDQRLNAGNLSDGGVTATTVPGNTFFEKIQYACQQSIRTYCEANQRCPCKERFRYPDEATCLDARLRDCSLNTAPAAAVSDGRLTLNEPLLAQVLESHRVEAARCEGTGYLPLVPFLEGHVSSGGDCSFSEEDISPRLSCQAGLTCELTGVQQGTLTQARCVPVRQLNEACTSDAHGYESSCGSTMFCAPAGTGGSCQLRRPSGASCTGTYQCESGSCSGPAGAATCAKSEQVLHPPYCDVDQCGLRSVSSLGAECGRSWQCGARLYEVQCKPAPSGTSSQCTCLKDTIVTGSFTSAGFCSATQAIQASAASEACGWTQLAP